MESIIHIPTIKTVYQFIICKIKYFKLILMLNQIVNSIFRNINYHNFKLVIMLNKICLSNILL